MRVIWPAGYPKMFTARETTSTATTSEIASSDIIVSFAQGLIAETSVGLKAATALRSPERAWARASVHPHSSPYMRRPRRTMASMSTEYFQSRSWRT